MDMPQTEPIIREESRTKYAVAVMVVVLVGVGYLFFFYQRERTRELAVLTRRVAKLQEEVTRIKAKVDQQNAVINAQKKLDDAQKIVDLDKEKALKMRDINLTLATMRNIVQCIELYYVEIGELPDSLETIQLDYMPSLRLFDPWDNEIIYILQENNRKYQLISKGADGELNTADDISYSDGRYIKPDIN